MGSRDEEVLAEVARGHLTAAAAQEKLGAPVARACDVVETALAPARVFDLRNSLGAACVEHTSGVPRLRVERCAAASTAEAAEALLACIKVECDADAVRVSGPSGAAIDAVLTVSMNHFDTLIVEGVRVAARDLGGELVCRARDGVEVAHCGGSLEAWVEAGEAHVTDVCGRIVLSVARGSVRVENASGHLEVDCLVGDVNIEGFAGDIFARAPQGEVRVRGARRH